MTSDPSEEPPGADEATGLEVRIAVRDAVDPGFVEEAAGPAFYTHLRGAEAIVDFRTRALIRAYEGYEQALAEKVPEPELGGLGLLVLQRVFLVVEDLGGLIRRRRVRPMAAPDLLPRPRARRVVPVGS